MKEWSLVCLVAVVLFFGAVDVSWAEMVKHHNVLTENDDPNACLECHSVSMSPDGKECNVDCGTLLAHPNFRKYPPVDREKEFAAMEQAIAQGVRFYNGEVACTSCHNLNSRLENMLVVEKQRGKLCKTCHLALFK